MSDGLRLRQPVPKFYPGPDAYAAPTHRAALLVAAISVTPARRVDVLHTARSLLLGSRPPDHLLLGAPSAFDRFPNATLDLDAVREQIFACRRTKISCPPASARAAVETLRCATDDGPGTKLLCTLPRALQLAARAASRISFVVLADDDRIYKPHALQVIETLLLAAAARGARPAGYSFYTFPCNLQYSKKAPNPGTVRCGQGADLLALPLDALRPSAALRAWYEAACRLDHRFRFHDDLWISLYMHDAANTTIIDVPQLATSNGSLNQNLSSGWMVRSYTGNVFGSPASRSTALRSIQFGGLNKFQLHKVLYSLRSRLVNEWRKAVSVTADTSLASQANTNR